MLIQNNFVHCMITIRVAVTFCILFSTVKNESEKKFEDHIAILDSYKFGTVEPLIFLFYFFSFTSFFLIYISLFLDSSIFPKIFFQHSFNLRPANINSVSFPSSINTREAALQDLRLRRHLFRSSPCPRV